MGEGRDMLGCDWTLRGLGLGLGLVQGKTYNNSVNLICHGGYPFKTTIGVKTISRSGSVMSVPTFFKS